MGMFTSSPRLPVPAPGEPAPSHKGVTSWGGSRPPVFPSPTFSGKVRFAASLQELSRLIPVEPAHVPEPVRR